MGGSGVAATGAQTVLTDPGAKKGAISSRGANIADGGEIISLYLPRTQVQSWMVSAEQTQVYVSPLKNVVSRHLGPQAPLSVLQTTPVVRNVPLT